MGQTGNIATDLGLDRGVDCLHSPGIKAHAGERGCKVKVLSLDHMPWVATLLRRTAIVQKQMFAANTKFDDVMCLVSSPTDDTLSSMQSWYCKQRALLAALARQKLP